MTCTACHSAPAMPHDDVCVDCDAAFCGADLDDSAATDAFFADDDLIGDDELRRLQQEADDLDFELSIDDLELSEASDYPDYDFDDGRFDFQDGEFW